MSELMSVKRLREVDGRAESYIYPKHRIKYDLNKFYALCFDDVPARLAHSHIEGRRDCSNFGIGDQFNCYYLFGDTVLHTVHGYGECPHLKKDGE